MYYLFYFFLLLFMAINSLGAYLIDDRFFIDTLRECITLSPELEKTFDDLACNHGTSTQEQLFNNAQTPLFRAYPGLRTTIAHRSLGNFPTPIEQLKALGDYCHKPNLYIKRDDKSSGRTADGAHCFGGNKVRKLEFLLADACAHHAQTVLTFGCVGSNHIVATTDYARLLGLKTIAMLMPQPNAHIVRRNLYLMHTLGAEMIYAPNPIVREEMALDAIIDHKKKYGNFPYVIPVGGSNIVGTIGYVNAVFELKEQIASGVMPEPDHIYVTVGSCGTFAGLLLGVRMAGLKTRVVGVCIYPESKTYSFAECTLHLVQKTNEMLHGHDKKIPLYQWKLHDITLLRGFEGSRYGIFSQEGVAAAQLLNSTQGVHLDGVYTGKAFAGMLADSANLPRESVILFWHTFYADELDKQKNTYNYRQLQECFHSYFEHPVQELDNN